MGIQCNINQEDSTLNPSQILVICTLMLLVGGLYLNSVGNLFTNWDDGMIYSNTQVRSLNWENIVKIFSLERGATYQPIRVLSYAVDYYFWKLNPVGYHITNILFYMLTCLAVFLSLKMLSINLRQGASESSHQRVALFGSLLFAAHPVHVEAVTWLSARKEVLQGFFFFFAFYLYLKGREEEKGKKRILYLGIVILSTLLATLSKPSAVIFPGVILLYEMTQRKEGLINYFKKHWVFMGSLLVISAIFTFILMKIMLEAGGIKTYRGFNLASNIFVSLYAFLQNIKLLTFTINYSAAYSFNLSLPLFCLKNVILMSIGFSLFVISLVSLRKTKVIFFSFFFFLLALLPYLNIIPISIVLADRYVFIASFSYVFLLGILFDRLYAYRQKIFSEGFFKLLSITLFLFLLVSYSLVTIRQNKIWENSYTLWNDAVAKYPESNTANALMGVVYMELGMDQEAIRHLEKAVEILPHDYQSRNNLGIVYGRIDQPEKALEELMTAIQIDPENDTIKINLSVFYQKQKEYEKSEEILKYLLSKYPDYDKLYFRLGLLYKEMGHYEDAISAFKKTSELSPNIINPYEEIGNIYLSRLKDKEKAKYYYIKGMEASPKAKLKVEEMRWMIQDLECHR